MSWGAVGGVINSLRDVVADQRAMVPVHGEGNVQAPQDIVVCVIPVTRI